MRFGDSSPAAHSYSSPSESWEQHGPAAQALAAVQTLREMNADNLRKVPADAPTAFIKPRWKPLMITRKASTGNSRNLRPVRAEERPALRRHLVGRGSSATSTTTCAGREFAALKREQLPRRSTRTATSTEGVCSCWTSSWPVTRPAGTTSCRCHPHRVRAENHPLDAAVPDRAQALIDQTSQLLRASRSPNC